MNEFLLHATTTPVISLDCILTLATFDIVNLRCELANGELDHVIAEQNQHKNKFRTILNCHTHYSFDFLKDVVHFKVISR